MTPTAETPGQPVGGPGPDSIVGHIAEADRRRRLRARVIFVATWAAIIGGLVAILALGGAIDLEFLNEGPPWWQFILGEVSVTTDSFFGIGVGPFQFVVSGAFATILISVVAITLAIVGAEVTYGGVPGFVIGIFVSLFVLFNSFAVNQWLQYRKVGPWRSYAFGEAAYLVLSLVAKTALAWQVFAGALAS